MWQINNSFQVFLFVLNFKFVESCLISIGIELHILFNSLIYLKDFWERAVENFEM